jgi:hypothetical protein
VPEALVELREEKEKLTKELIEHGCRRKNWWLGGKHFY